MRLLRGPLPAALRGSLPLERGERVLATAPTRGGSHVVATTTALHLPTAADEFVRLPYERIDTAAWKDGWLHVTETSRAARHVRLTEPGSVPETIRERVTATVVISHRAELRGGGVRIAGRRPAAGGDVRWTFVFDAGMDPDDPGLRAQAEQILEGLRRQTGL